MGPDPVRDRGGIDIGFLECCRRAGDATGQQRGLAVRGRAPPRGGRRTRASYPSRRAVGVRMVHFPLPNGPQAATPRIGRQCARDSGRSIPRLRAPARAGRAGARPPRRASRRAAAAGPALAHGAVAPARPTPAGLLLGWSFDPLVWLPAIVALLLWRSGVDRVARAHPAQPVARRRIGLVDARRARRPARPRLGDRALRHDAVLGPHGPAPAADAGGAAVPALRGPDHAPAPGVDAGGPPSLDPAGPPLAGRAVPRVPGRLVDHLRRRHVGEPLLAAVRPRARERVGAPPRARAVPRRRRSCSGGPSWARTRRRGA